MRDGQRRIAHAPLLPRRVRAMCQKRWRAVRYDARCAKDSAVANKSAESEARQRCVTDDRRRRARSYAPSRQRVLPMICRDKKRRAAAARYATRFARS